MVTELVYDRKDLIAFCTQNAIARHKEMTVLGHCIKTVGSEELIVIRLEDPKPCKHMDSL